jgi:hypothetical protein
MRRRPAGSGGPDLADQAQDCPEATLTPYVSLIYKNVHAVPQRTAYGGVHEFR